MECPAGTFGDTLQLTTPACSGPCSLGYECPPGSTTSKALVCPKGNYCSGGPRVPCPPGRYSNITGTTSLAGCTLCAPGTFSGAEGAVAASTCAPCGVYEGSGPGATKCWPGVVSAAASNPPPLVPGFSVGDVVTVTFSSPTNTPDAGSVLAFSPSIGVTSASWRSGGTELVVRVVDARGVSPAAVDVVMRQLAVRVSGVRVYGGGSDPSPPITVTVGGSWGAPSAPTIQRATAMDTGHNVGVDTGDTLVVEFDQAVAPVEVASSAAVHRLLVWQPPLPADTQVAGTWSSNTTVLTLVFAAFTLPASSRDWLPWNVGSLVVTVRPQANLTSANGESAASNASVVVDEGSWGDAPVGVVSPASSVMVTLTLAPPSTSSPSVVVDTYVVRWLPVGRGGGTASWPLSVAAATSWLGTQPSATVDVRSVDDVIVSSVVGSASLVYDAGPVPGTVVGSGNGGWALVRVVPEVAVRRGAVSFPLPGLTTLVPYTFQCACNSVGDTMGPAVPTSPSSLVPQPPIITLVMTSGTVLDTAGTGVVDVVGDQVGGLGAVVLLSLFNGAHGPFVSAPCTIVVPSHEVRCVAPQGVGAGHRVSISVDGVNSAPFMNRTLSYAAPVVLRLSIVRAVSLEADGAVGTGGGSVVTVTGAYFGECLRGGVL
jgi:hypothetical protein